MAKYPLFAAVSGQTILDEAFFRARDSLNDFLLVYEGTQRDAKTGSGVVENNLSQYSYAVRFRTNGTSEIGRIEVEIRKEGEGVDLIVALVEGFSPDGSNDGTVIIERLMPKEFLSDTKRYVSIPMGVEGLIPDAYYWLVFRQNGDTNNNVRLIGENNQDALYPVWRRTGNSGAWTAESAIHFKIFSGESGNLLHGIYGSNGITWVEYSGEIVSKVYRYLPPSDGPDGGIRDIITYTWVGEYLKRGEVG